MSRFKPGDRLMCVADSQYTYGPNVVKGQEYECLDVHSCSVHVTGGGGYGFSERLFISGKTVTMVLATTTYEVAEVPFEDATDKDSDWESWGWTPSDKKPTHFLSPKVEGSWTCALPIQPGEK